MSTSTRDAPWTEAASVFLDWMLTLDPEADHQAINELLAKVEREAFWNGVKSVEEVHRPGARTFTDTEQAMAGEPPSEPVPIEAPAADAGWQHGARLAESLRRYAGTTPNSALDAYEQALRERGK